MIPTSSAGQAGILRTESAPHLSPYADLYTFHWDTLSLRTSLIAVLAVAIALIGGVLAGHPSGGLLVGAGAMQIGFGMNQRIADSRLWPMIAASFAMMLSTFAGMALGHFGYGVVLAATLWSFCYGVMTFEAAGIAWVGQQAAVTLLVTSAFPASATDAAQRALLTFAGGFLQVGLTSLFLKLLPELRHDLRYLPRYGLQEARHLRHAFGWHRVQRRLVGLPRALPKLIGATNLRFAVRMALTVALATEIYRWRGFQSGYWVPMTALLVQKPLFAETLTRSLLRVGGTLGGAVLTTVFLRHVHPDPFWLAVLASTFCFGAYLTVSINYGLYALFLTSYIVFLLSLNTLPGPEIAHRRAVATAVGGAIALIVHIDALRRRRVDPTVR